MLAGELVRRLRCPACRSEVRIGETVDCAACGLRFPIEDGVPRMISPPPAAGAGRDPRLDLTLLILAYNEGENLRQVLTEVRRVVEDLSLTFELVVVDGGSRDNTVEVAREQATVVHVQTAPGYGNAFREGIALCRGRYVITLDADLSHDPNFLRVLWQHRDQGSVVIGSRYVPGGEADMPLHRKLLSMLLNRVAGTTLSVAVRDLSSGLRLYRTDALDAADLAGRDFDILVELIVKLYARGHRIYESPFFYKPRGDGSSNVRLDRFALSYLRALVRLWRLRNSISSADYDFRAYHSLIPPQRYWQRTRYKIIMRFLDRRLSDVLDVGCGSSKIIQSLPGAVGLDVNYAKLRFLRRTNPLLVQGSVFALPFADESFETVICSQVIEHIPDTDAAMAELVRVLRPGGLMILGTPDYATINWRVIEPIYERVVPGNYAGEHITHLTRTSLHDLLDRHGLDFLEEDYILHAEWISRSRKRLR